MAMPVTEASREVRDLFQEGQVCLFLSLGWGIIMDGMIDG